MYTRIEKSLVSGHSSCIDAALKSAKTIFVYLAIMLAFASTGLGDVIVGNWENQMDGWATVDATAADPCQGVGNTLSDYSLKVAVPNSWHSTIIRDSGLLPDITAATQIKVDITLIASEWDFGALGWVKAIENVVLQDDMSSWQQLSPVGEVGWNGESDQTITATFNVPTQTVPLTWAQLVIVTNYDKVTTAGNFYFDNFRFVTPDMAVNKCKVTAGKTQYYGDEDYNDMKDSFTASGTLMLPDDCNDINEVIVTLTNDQDEVIYTETFDDFNASTVNRSGKFTHSAKLIKGQPGKVSSLVIDFRQGTFAVAAKNVDLTGLTAPFELKFEIGSFEQKGTVNENVINGSSKTIPTRLMRLYDDKLVTTKAVASHKTTPFTDVLNFRGEIAVADMNVDSNEPNLANEVVTLAWGDINDANTRTFVIPAGSFKAAKKGHVYKCSKVEADANDSNAGFIAGTIDLDACTYQFAINKADDIYAVRSTEGKFSISFDTEQGTFDEEDQCLIP